MMGLDKMLSQMIGMTPDEMKAFAEQTKHHISTMATMIVDMNGKLDKLLEEKNGGGK